MLQPLLECTWRYTYLSPHPVGMASYPHVQLLILRLPLCGTLHRDLDDIGATDIVVQPLNKLPYGRIDASKAKFGDGVIFLTYSSLISSSDKVRSMGSSHVSGQ